MSAEWLPIATAPKDGTDILGANAEHVFVVFWLHNAMHPKPGSWVSRPGCWAFSPTHWMPLPPAPVLTTQLDTDS